MPLLCAPRALLFEDLPGRIKEMGVTHVGIVPSLIEATMAAAVMDVEEDGQTGMKLRYIASGGEKMSDSVSHSVSQTYRALICAIDIG